MKLSAILQAVRIGLIVYLGGYATQTEPRPEYLPGHSADALPAFRKALAYQGVMARVARQAGVSRTHVYLIATGKRKSVRVNAALVSELQRLEAGEVSRSLKGAIQ